MNRLLLCVLAIFLMITPALGVTTSEREEITDFDMDAPAGYYISSIYLEDIVPDFNTTILMDADGQIYTLQVNATRTLGWWSYDISLEHPNGTVESQHMGILRPLEKTSIKIQHFYGTETSILTVNLYVGLLPLTTTFSSIGLSDAYEDIAFSNVQGSCTQPFDLIVYLSTAEEMVAQQDNSIKQYLEGSTELFTEWLWDNIITFIEKIPGIGPYLADSLEFTAMLIDNVFFYFRLFFIDYLATTLLTIEFFILSKALITTRKNANIFALLDKIVSAHVDTFEFVIDTLSKIISMFSALVHMIAAIVSAIKPI